MRAANPPGCEKNFRAAGGIAKTPRFQTGRHLLAENSVNAAQSSPPCPVGRRICASPSSRHAPHSITFHNPEMFLSRCSDFGVAKPKEVGYLVAIGREHNTPNADCAPVAQLDRASDYESEGQRFESFRARHFRSKLGTVMPAPGLSRTSRSARACFGTGIRISSDPITTRPTKRCSHARRKAGLRCRSLIFCAKAASPGHRDRSGIAASGVPCAEAADARRRCGAVRAVFRNPLCSATCFLLELQDN